MDRRLEALRRVLPDGPQPEADAAHVNELTRAAGLPGPRIGVRPPLETGSAGETKVDVTGTAGFGDVDRFFRLVSSSPRLVDVEELRLRAAGPDGALTYTAILSLPFRPAKAPLARVPEGARPSFQGVGRVDADTYLRDQALALDKTLRISELRRTRRNPRVFLTEISSALRGRPAQLVDATLGNEFFLRGLVLGEGGMHGLESRLDRGFLRVSGLVQLREGPCFRFEARGTSPVVGPDAELSLPTSSPFGDGTELCASDRDEARRLVVRAPKRAPKAPRGPVNVQARAVDAADLFQILAAVGVGEFVVDPNVVGRLDVNLPGVTPSQALDAVRQAGLGLEAAGPLIHVKPTSGSRDTLPAPASGTVDVRFAAKRAPAAELLEALAEVAPGGPTGAPPGVAHRRLSLWTRSADPAAVRAALAGLLGVDGAWQGPRLVPPASDDRPTRLAADDVTLAEFDLAALASRDGVWTAFAYAPDGRMHAYRTGDRLADGRITAVESMDVLVETDEGAVRLLLRP